MLQKLSCILFFSLSFCFINTSFGQQVIRCNTDHYMAEYLQDQKRANEFHKKQKEIREKVDFNQRIACSETIIIPVAVHFYGDVDDSDMQCLEDVVEAQIAVLNEDFSATNADISEYDEFSDNCPDDFPASALGTGACLEFCLAQYNHPTCSSLSDGDKAITIGEESWPSAPCWSGYLNFFVTNEIGFLGQAPVNGGANPDGNGVQVVASSFGGPGVSCTSGTGLNTDGTYNLGRTGTHELGHYFNLLHVFDGCNDGDNIPDTPDQNSENFGCPTLDISTCETTAGNTCSENDFFFNFMDYVNDACMWMFTEDQCQEMFNSADHDLWADHSLVCESPVAPVASFTPTEDQEFCPDDAEITFNDTSINGPNEWSWTFSGPGVSPTSSTLQNPTVTFTISGNYTISLTASNGGGSDTHTENIYVEVLSAADPTCDNCEYELVLWDRNESGWTPIQSLDLTINGVTTNYDGPTAGNLSQSILFDVYLNDDINIECTPGSGSDADEIAWRLFDEEGRAILGDGDSFGLGPVNTQGSNGPVLLPPDIGPNLYTGNCDAVLNCEDYQLEITFDNYPEETAWWMKDDLGNFEYQSKGYQGEGGNTITVDMCLVEGCHDFTIIDFYGDGICCSYGNGSYEITKVSNGSVVASGGEFDGSETTEICVDFGPSCETVLDLNGDLLNQTYSVTDEIMSNGKVKMDTVCVFQAPNVISLNAPFEVELGGEFTAEMGECVEAISTTANSFILREKNGDVLIINGTHPVQLLNTQGKLIRNLAPHKKDAARTIKHLCKGLYYLRHLTSDGHNIEKVLID